ncbi:MAG: class A beta-lactamase [Terracidiphilus sp.]|nr:class A beta-lactamase [Terracidiphilus sp.]
MGTFDLSRRALLEALALLGFSFSSFPGLSAQLTAEEQFTAVEKGIGGRLGVAAVDTRTGRRVSYRSSELFPMCSTFKFLLAACILHRVDGRVEHLLRPIPYTEKDLLEYAPVTTAHVQQGAMSVGELCAASIEVSDNTAANLLLTQIGGPIRLTEFIRTLGNEVTRLDRIEPELNSAVPGDPRDTTSAAAMLDSMEKLLTGNALSGQSRVQLTTWLKGSTTGSKRLRAGMPANWRAGDKTGTGEHGAMGDVGIFWPPGKKPILMAVYLKEGQAAADMREQAIASVGRVVTQVL